MGSVVRGSNAGSVRRYFSPKGSKQDVARGSPLRVQLSERDGDY